MLPALTRIRSHPSPGYCCTLSRATRWRDASFAISWSGPWTKVRSRLRPSITLRFRRRWRRGSRRDSTRSRSAPRSDRSSCAADRGSAGYPVSTPDRNVCTRWQGLRDRDHRVCSLYPCTPRDHRDLDRARCMACAFAFRHLISYREHLGRSCGKIRRGAGDIRNGGLINTGLDHRDSSGARRFDISVRDSA